MVVKDFLTDKRYAILIGMYVLFMVGGVITYWLSSSQNLAIISLFVPTIFTMMVASLYKIGNERRLVLISKICLGFVVVVLIRRFFM